MKIKSVLSKSTLYYLIFGLFLLVAFPLQAQRGDDAQRKSKNGKTEGTIDEIKVVLEYGRPKVKDRVIWGDLVPYGKVWRTGADEATTISFDADVLVEDKPLAKGKYALFTIPGKETWTVIFNTVPNQWGAYKYDESKDALRVVVKPQAGEHIEEMDFLIEGNQVVLRWEKLRVPFAVAAAK